ncbi:Protein of unknown function DUF604 - like 10 [Theobroma cacao]|nr:Protein of unknown function DUF604 - like 10 [Theobroma cacao]
MQQKFRYLSVGALCKFLPVSGLVLFFFYTFLYSHFCNQSSAGLFSTPFEHRWLTSSTTTSNSPTNISHIRFVLVENHTLKPGGDQMKLWVNEDIAKLITYPILANPVEVLAKYDHTKYCYIGTNSESVKSNYDFSFDMGYGGAGYALSYSLVEALASVMDNCIERYPHFYVSDHLSSSCSADLGVGLTIEKGIHQIDVVGDISGLLSHFTILTT